MKRIVSMALSALLLIGCQEYAADAQNRNGGRPAKTGQIDPRLADATNRFGFNLLARLRAGDSVGSTMISPASIAMALAMTYNGADGATKEQMASALEVSGLSLEDLNVAHAALREILTDPNSDITLDIANSLWARAGMPFDTNFMARNRDYFAARIENLNFDDPASAGTINGWVKDKTRNKIPSIVDEIDPATILFLINAIYFKGTWTYQFEPKSSYDGAFHHPSGDKTRKFMFQEDDYDYLDREGFEAIRIPYGKSQRFAMYVFLPDEESTVAEFAAGLSPDRWKEWTSSFVNRNGQLRLPRFTLTYDEQLNTALQDLGMPEAFDPMRADFSQMISVPGANAYISKVKHKTFMEVNEEGTEVAAVTSVEVGITSIGPDGKFVMTVDRPFFCAIADKESGLILFMGTVSEYE